MDVKRREQIIRRTTDRIGFEVMQIGFYLEMAQTEMKTFGATEEDMKIFNEAIDRIYKR